MLLSRLCFVLGFLFSATAAADKTCAKNYSELENTPALQKLKTILENNKTTGFVNKTEGSYFFISPFMETSESSPLSSRFIITFYTTGFLDLYGIQKSGPIIFCDDDGQLTAIGLDRTQNIFVDGARIEFGSRSAKESFTRGPMPAKLARINELDARTLASY
ncbi:MAG: hypothetical protein IT287_06320 [Bdellovibrionaceae bacterium]|nr:hypothetical protein [Pseudobdellovibrionaceae bacterium]